MILDTSALVAVVVREPGYEDLLALLESPSAPIAIGTPTVVELGIVLSARLGIDATAMLDELLEHTGAERVEFTERHWRAAVGAFWRFGRGRHRAGLNFGDCLTYAVAKVADEPLLYVGDDFAATDLPSVR